jgi:hypothetical protein
MASHRGPSIYTTSLDSTDEKPAVTIREPDGRARSPRLRG